MKRNTADKVAEPVDLKWIEPDVRYFDDFEIGQAFKSPGLTITTSDVVSFGLMYDPQPFHIDEEAASAAPFGGLVASGLQSLALAFRLFFMLRVHAGSSLGGWGLDEVRWPAPLRPGDTLQCQYTVVAKELSLSKPDRGTVRFKFEGMNRNGVVVSFIANLLISRRPPKLGFAEVGGNQR